MSIGFLDAVEQRGEQRGELRGVDKGQRELVRLQIERRLGPLSEAAQSRLAGWPAERLTELGIALLSATSLQQLGLED